MIIQITGIWNDFLFGRGLHKPNVYRETVQLNNIVKLRTGREGIQSHLAAPS